MCNFYLRYDIFTNYEYCLHYNLIKRKVYRSKKGDTNKMRNRLSYFLRIHRNRCIYKAKDINI